MTDDNRADEPPVRRGTYRSPGDPEPEEAGTEGTGLDQPGSEPRDPSTTAVQSSDAEQRPDVPASTEQAAPQDSAAPLESMSSPSDEGDGATETAVFPQQTAVPDDTRTSVDDAPAPVDDAYRTSRPTPPAPIVTEHPVAGTGEAEPASSVDSARPEPTASDAPRPAGAAAASAAPEREPAAPADAERGDQERPAAEESTPTPAPVAEGTAVLPAPMPASTADRGADAPTAAMPTPVAPPTAQQRAQDAPTTQQEARAVYVEAPTPPKKKGNRGFGALIALLATLVFALAWAAVAAVVIALATDPSQFVDSLTNFLASAAFITPVVVFFVAFLLTVLLLNRAAWAWYILIGFLVAALVYLGYLGGALITVAPRITQSEVEPFLRDIALTPLAIGAGLVARELTIWAGALVAARGRKVKERNHRAQEEYERELAARRAEYERARSGAAN